MLLLALSAGLTTEKTDIYILIGKSWPKKVKKYFFGIFFCGHFPSNTVCTPYTALLDIPKNRFDRFGPTFVFLKYLLSQYL